MADFRPWETVSANFAAAVGLEPHYMRGWDEGWRAGFDYASRLALTAMQKERQATKPAPEMPSESDA